MREDHELIGVWKLLSFDIEYQESSRREPFYGDVIPVGYIIFTPEARMMALMATCGREPDRRTHNRPRSFARCWRLLDSTESNRSAGALVPA
jgi:hypothetical protein